MERILIAEDSPTQREMLRHTLARHGFDVVTAVDGEDAWSRIEQIAPTIVVTDIMMPRMDGYALCRAIKQHARFASVPVVLLTSLSDPKDVIVALESKADGFVGKPFVADHLISRIHAVIANRDLPRGGTDQGGIEINHGGRNYTITAERRQILELLLSVYDMAVRRNLELAEAQAGLQRLNAELEQKVRDRTRRLEDSNRSLETFCYTVAHDLRAPLRSIQGYMFMLEEDYANGLGDKARDYVTRASTAANRMDTLILDLLAYGRVSHAETQLEEVDARAEVERLLQERAEEIDAKHARMTLELPDVRLRTSRILFAQIVQNLLDNALKFARPGEVPTVRIELQAIPGGARLIVADEGIGIDPKYQGKIFNVFERLHTGPFPGTGIGLAIVRKAVDRLGGSIAVQSEPNRGTTFTVELPSLASS